MLATPASSTLTGTAEPTVSGTYQGSTNQVFTCTISGTGEVGVETDLMVEVRNGAGELVATLNVGQNYAGGDPLEIAAGVYVSISHGTLNDGETFTIEALAEADTSGLLAAAGMNVLFNGNSAATMGVCQDLLAHPELLATAIGADLSDNLNVVRMAELAQAPLPELGDATPSEFYQLLVARVGEDIHLRQARQTSVENVLQQLVNQRDGVSGVDINEEAAKLLVFERMFQAMAKFLNVQDQSLQYLLESM